MPTIDELHEMEFINWDAAVVGTGSALPVVSEGAADPIDAVGASSSDPNMDLAFENIEGDDWSYWALEHFESTQIPQDVDTSAVAEAEPAANPQMYWETPEAPCTHCALGGYQCKRIREGKYKGYCTSCVALRCGCSFGPSINNLTAEAGATFPANPWPTMGDRPETSILHEDDMAAIIASAPPDQSLVAVSDSQRLPPTPQHTPKIGARFSRESVKVLKNWLATHSRHPYPTEEEKESLQKITGLNKTQIVNWMANARRRGKIQPMRATSPHIGRGYAQAIDIPQRRATPGLFANMNPMERWANSPPEHEPASVTAIARAVSASSSYSQTSGSGRNSPYISNYSDDGSSRSLCNQSSASSLGTSHSSNGSFASAYSTQSHGSFGSTPSFVRTRGRRRRRRAPPKRADQSLNQPVKTFQCTFCTETFRTKHDWQRHEKSLHLSLERWICSPDGPRTVSHENGTMCCVFCGEANPDDAHVESHNFSGCTERTQEERTFYRKDHLRQHLKLVHNIKFLPWTMDTWRVASPEIRSRCGFCGLILDSWTVRVDHLAEHFKTGNTMADWKGDWGFEAPVLEMVENSIPPYMIHDERNSPSPCMPSGTAPPTPNNAYELLKYELQYWMTHMKEDAGKTPTDAEIQHEACRILFSAELSSQNPGRVSASWLSDLVRSSEEATRSAISRSVRDQAEVRMTTLRINGKDDIFESCEFEKQLQDFAKARTLLGLTAMDQELQVEACRIIGRMEEKSSQPSEDVANWLIRLIYASSSWLQDFRQRAHLPRSEDVGDAYKRSKDPTTIDSTVHNYSRLDYELGEFLRKQRSMGIDPADADLQRQARIIIYEHDDEWNQTAADDKEWLDSFRQRHSFKKSPTASMKSASPNNLNTAPPRPENQAPARDSQYLGSLPSTPANCLEEQPSGTPLNSTKARPFFLNDINCYNRLARGLSRFVASTMSANNPNRHVPTDEEIQHQARWIVYDDDDPWNQTAADNFEWLQRFKRDVGILPANSGPGLGTNNPAQATSESGTGLPPPYVTPNLAAVTKLLKSNLTTHIRDQARRPAASNSTATPFPQNPTQRHPAPAGIFCSRDLETGLAEYVRRELHRTGGVFPGDEQLRARARAIVGMETTSCDDPVLLGRFKAAVQQGDGSGSTAPPGLNFGPITSGITIGLASVDSADVSAAPLTADEALALPGEMDLDLEFGFTEREISDMLQDVSPDFGSVDPRLL